MALPPLMHQQPWIN